MAAVLEEISALYQQEPLKTLFKAWGREGGRTRTKRLSAEERRAIARKAARARWKGRKTT